MDFSSALSISPPSAHLVANGELDVFAGVELRHRLDEAIDSGCIRFTVDMSAITFVDAGGLGTLVRLRNTVAPFGGTVAVVAANPRFRQIAALVGLAEVFDIDLLPDAHPPTRAPVVPIGQECRRDVTPLHFVVSPRSEERPVSRGCSVR